VKNRTLAVLSLASFAIFVILALAVKVSSGYDSADFSAAVWVNHLDLGPTGTVLVLASLYGREYFWVPVVALMLLLGDRRTKALALGLSAVFIVGIVAGEAAKDIVARARPYNPYVLNPLLEPIIPRVPIDADFSFPSGHAVIVSIGAVFALATFRKRWVSILLTLEAAMVCISRVYVGAHYPTDVVAGVALGASIALGGLYVGRVYFPRPSDRGADALTKVLKDGPLEL
jgi:undecaprenyl-diphosphatase